MNCTLRADSAEYDPQRKTRIGAADREGERALSQSKEDKRQMRKSEKNEMREPGNDQTNTCQMRIKSVGWTGISHNRAITLAHYPTEACHNICITLL